MHPRWDSSENFFPFPEGQPTVTGTNGRKMNDWFHELPVLWMALLVFGITYLLALGIHAAQREIISALESALDARRQRIIVSLTEVNAVKWACLYLQALCALLAIAFVHCDDRLSSLLAMGLFATGVSASVLLIAAHDRPFVGEVAVTPKPLLQIVSDPLTKR